MDIASTNMTNTIPTNMRNTTSTNMSTNPDDKKIYKMDCYILHIVLSVTILLFIIALICYHYAKHKSKLKKKKTFCCTKNIRMQNNEF